MAGSEDIDLANAHRRAHQLVSSGKLDDARALLTQAMGQTYALEERYAPALALLGQVLEQQGDVRGALSCAWYLGDDKSCSRLAGSVPPADRARTHVAVAARLPEGDAQGKSYHALAADEFESAGLVAQAAVHREHAGQHERARALWSRLCGAIRQTDEADIYAAALARFNLARTARKGGDLRTAQESMVAAVHLLEEAADRYETVGQRERAFDCYQVLAAIGRDSGTTEHALEGYVNLVRILREDQLQSYALREFNGAIRFLRDKGEIAAAATLAREMGDYARREGRASVANHAVLAQAEMWKEHATNTLSRGGSPEIAENSLLAAVLACAELGQFQRAGRYYVELAHLPLEEARRVHYSRASARYEGARDEPIELASDVDSPREEALQDVWLVDLVEWEQKGSAAEVCADILIDTTTWSEVIRRRALLARLAALRVEGDPHRARPADRVALVSSLAPTELYVVLSPLEALFDRKEPEVRAAVARALGRFLYKRAFIALRRALDDSDANVRREACRSLEQLRFPHAFDPLARIYREIGNPEARMAALRALAHVDSDEAAELVLAALQHAGPGERADVVAALSSSCGGRFIAKGKDALARASGPMVQSLREVLRAQGIRGA